MACKYTYQGKTYESWEFAEMLSSMPASELMQYLPEEARRELAMASDISRQTVSWSQQRIDRLLSSYAYTMDDSRTKAYAAWVNPNDFLKATTPIDEVGSLESQKTSLDIDELANQKQEIYLEVKETDDGLFDVVGHEGRHRMMALRDAGVRSVPVVLVLRGGAKDAAKIIAEPYFKAQKWHDTKAQRGFYSESMIPISWEYSKELKSAFGAKADFMFSAESQFSNDTIEVDGKTRPTTNSNGKPIAQTEEWLRNFWRWFGSSRVVDAEGRPMVVYHGTQADFSIFRTSRGDFGDGIYTTSESGEASDYANNWNPVRAKEGANVMPVYVSLQNPYYTTPEDRKLDGDDVRKKAEKLGHDGIIRTWKNSDQIHAIAFSPTQVKSASGNRGTFDPADANILASVSFNPMDYVGKIEQSSPKIASAIRDVFTTQKTFNWWHRTLGSQSHKATLSPAYKRVYDAATNYEQDTARFASESADLAPDLVPKMDTLGDAKKQIQFFKQNSSDFNTVSPWVFYGTLTEVNLLDPKNAHYLSDPSSLIAKYGDLLPKDQPLKPLTERQIDLLRQYHAATNFSLDVLAKTEMTRLAKLSKLLEADQDLSMQETASFYFDQIAGEMEIVESQINDLMKQQKSELDLLEDAANDEASDAEKRKTYAKLLTETKARHKTELDPLMHKLSDFKILKDGFIGKAQQVEKLKSEGYAPLMRFGKYTVDVALKNEDGTVVKDSEGNEIRQFFGMFESESEANAVAREMQEEYPDSTVTQGILSEKQFSLFKGVTPETAEAYAKMLGMESDDAFQKYLKLAASNRSAMKRLIKRKGTAGFSFDMTRNLASFITSNSRAASANLHMADMIKAVTHEDMKGKGDVQDEAIDLLNYVRDPQEKGLAIRSLMFFQFLGGSVSAAAVNMTQTFTTTLPYLSQDKFGGAKAAAQEITKAMRLAGSRTFRNRESTGDAELDKMLKLAEEEGVVAPHEMHMLQGEASRGASRATQNIVWRMLENKYPPLRHTSRLLDALSAGWGSLFSIAEQYNRQVAFIASYNLAKAQGKTKEQAFEIAKQAVSDTQFNYTKSARPNWGRSAVGATLLTFKSFIIQYSEFLRRLAKEDPKAFGIALGVLFLLAGAQGLPGADDLDDLIDTLRQATGHRGNSKEWKRESIEFLFGSDEFGKAATNFLLHGVSAFMPLDISGRLSVGNMIPATAVLKKSDKDFGDDTLEVIGPVGAYVKKILETTKSVEAGKGVAASVMENVAPKAIADAYKAIDMLQTGAYRDYKGRKIVDVDASDAFWKSIGFQPNSVAEVRRVERIIQQDITLFRNVKADVSEMWARGIFERDPDKVAHARDVMEDWNENNPAWKMMVKPANIQRRVNEMGKLSADRITKAAPKDVRATVGSTLKADS